MEGNDNINRDGPPRLSRSFSAPDRDTFTFVFIKSKYGLLRVAEFVCTNVHF